MIVLLGTNDFQSLHQFNAWHSSQGVHAIIAAIRRAPVEPGMPIPEILVVAPPSIQEGLGPNAPKFQGAEKKAVGLRDAVQKVASDTGCHFFDAGSVTATSKVDGVHLDEDQHRTLGLALAGQVKFILHFTDYVG